MHLVLYARCFILHKTSPIYLYNIFLRKVLTYLQKYAIIISEQRERKPLEDLKGGINMNMKYRFTKNGKEYFATGKKLNGGEYAEIYKNKVTKTGIIK